VRFWDSSAIVPLILDEPNATRVQELLERDEQMAVWWSTPVECWSALERSQRAQRIGADVVEEANRLLDALRSAWFEVAPSEEVRMQARRLLRIHRLRAADALQLGAALVWAGRWAEGEFVSFDERLREAAHLEGLALV
jgi:uncharacterized protein